MAGSTTQQFKVGIASGAPAQIDATAQQREVAGEMQLINPWDTPFLELIGSAEGSAGMNMKHEWPEGDLWSKSFTISSTTSATTDEVTLTLAGATAYQVMLGSVWLARTGGDYVQVTARASTTTLTVTRAYAGSTAAAVATGAVFDYVGVARQEGSDTVFKGHPVKSFPYNYYQLFEQGLEITKPAKTLKEYGMDRYEYEREDLMKVLKFGLEGSILLGKRYEGASTNAATLGGIYDFATSGNGAYVASLSSAALTESHINTGLRDRLDTVGAGNMATDVFVNGFVRQKLDSLYADRIRTTMDERSGGAVIDRIRTSIVDLDIHLTPNAIRNQLIILNPAKLKVVHWPGMNWYEGKLPSSGLTYEKEGIAGMFSFENRLIPTEIKLTAISTSS